MMSGPGVDRTSDSRLDAPMATELPKDGSSGPLKGPNDAG